MRFIQQLQCPTAVRMFDYSDGWAATHCHIGGLAALHRVLFDWLDTAVHHPERMPRHDMEGKVFDVLAKYMPSHEAKPELDQVFKAVTQVEEPSQPIVCAPLFR